MGDVAFVCAHKLLQVYLRYCVYFFVKLDFLIFRKLFFGKVSENSTCFSEIVFLKMFELRQPHDNKLNRSGILNSLWRCFHNTNKLILGFQNIQCWFFGKFSENSRGQFRKQVDGILKMFSSDQTPKVSTKVPAF